MGAPDLLRHLHDAGVALSLAGGGGIRVVPAGVLTDVDRQAICDHRAELISLLAPPAGPAADPTDGRAGRPYRLSTAEVDAAHAAPWNDADITRFTARVDRFMHLGIAASDADDLAERLHLRNVQGDDRRPCLECRHLTGRVGTGWRCGNFQEAELGRELPAELVSLPQRCFGFAEGTGNGAID